MQITAQHIEGWAKTKPAQAALPRYVRRLIHGAGSITQIAVPAGDSTSRPGWDGELASEQGNAWVPRGKSYWEMSCEAEVTSKANRDYAKRTNGTPEAARSAGTLVVLTARKWAGKAGWLENKRGAAEWADVRAYDADDLEQWLEQTPAVKLEFADELGLLGHGVETVDRHWAGWASQTDVAITPETFFVDREGARDRFLAKVRERLEEQSTEPVTVRADSVGEAAAFAAAALLRQPDLSVAALVVTEPAGWRFVEQNASLRVAVAARPELAGNPIGRAGTAVVVPYATGDMAASFRDGAGFQGEPDVVLERPSHQDFEKALVAISLDEGDAARLSRATGRSWSVFRRRRALNPALRRPAWLDAPQAASLSVLCLLGGWSGSKPADRSIVSGLARRDYEDVERELRHLARLDDAPVVGIGEVWRAKSSLELLDLFGDRITRDELDRFFDVAREILSQPDPELELPDEQRYAAQIYGKFRPQSGLLLRSLSDTLVKLSVRGPDVPTLVAVSIEARVAGLVRDLLHDADATRWLSLSSLLPDLAEAAPDVFVRSIEASLALPGAPVTRLLTETSASGAMGRCWYSGLLWALERLAWAPERFTRIAILLARLARVEIKGNWGNSPKRTLVGLFRTWLPQTAATLDQRVAALDALVGREPDVAFDLLDQLVHGGPDSAMPSARPSWRDDDAGAGRGVSGVERHGMLVAAADRLIACCRGDARRISRTLDKIGLFDSPRVEAVFALAEELADEGVLDGEREDLRDGLRRKIFTRRNYPKLRETVPEEALERLERLYERLAPCDLITRHLWLFADSGAPLPVRERQDNYVRRQELIEEARLEALLEIFQAGGLEEIERLATACPSLGHVGVTLTKLPIPDAALTAWIVERGGDFADDTPLVMTFRGLLRATEPERGRRLLRSLLDEARRSGSGAEKVARLLNLGREDRWTWDLAASMGPEVDDAYWRVCHLRFWLGEDDPEFGFVLRRLLAAGRPRTAFKVCEHDFTKVDPSILAEMLERVLRGEELEGVLPDPYHVGEALDCLEQSGAVERERLVRLGFGLIPILGFDCEARAATLYAALMSEPKLFAELICLVYKPANRERDEPITEGFETTARIAAQVLDACRRQPGTQAGGRVDHEAFTRFIDEARSICSENDRLAACDSTLGQILAHAPADADGVWPFEPARDVLDRTDAEGLRAGFRIGARNKRGVTTRAYDEGGGQERVLAETYRGFARALHNSHVNVADALEQLASWYESDAVHEDVQARLRREGH